MNAKHLQEQRKERRLDDKVNQHKREIAILQNDCRMNRRNQTRITNETKKEEASDTFNRVKYYDQKSGENYKELKRFINRFRQKLSIKSTVEGHEVSTIDRLFGTHQLE